MAFRTIEVVLFVYMMLLSLCKYVLMPVRKHLFLHVGQNNLDKRCVSSF